MVTSWPKRLPGPGMSAERVAEMDRLNIEALATLTTRDNAQLRTFPGDLVAAARAQASDVLGELAARSDKAPASASAFPPGRAFRSRRCLKRGRVEGKDSRPAFQRAIPLTQSMSP